MHPQRTDQQRWMPSGFCPPDLRKKRLFHAPLDHVYGLNAGGIGAATFTRATVGTYRAHDDGWNIVDYSEDGSQALWVAEQATKGTSSAVEPPMPNMTVNTVTETVASNRHGVYANFQAGDIFDAEQWTISMFVRRGTRRYCWIAERAGDWNRGVFDFESGVFTATLASVDSTHVQEWQDGWYRIGITITTTASQASFQPSVYLADSDAFDPYVGDAAESMFWTGAQAEPGSTMGPYRGTSGTPLGPIRHAASGEARFEANGYLAERARTNLLTYSEDGSDASWSSDGLDSVDPTGGVAPDGTSTANLFTEDGGPGSSVHRIYKGVTISNGDTTVMSTFAKAVDRTVIQLASFAAGGHGAFAYFDLSNGTVGTTGTSGSGTLVGQGIEDFGNGWYRCYVLATHSTATSWVPEFRMCLADGTASYTGDGSTILFWGYQAETDATFPSSYIPTVGSTVTRNADVLTWSNAANVPTTDGTFWLEGDLVKVDTNNLSFAAISDGDTSDYVRFQTVGADDVSARCVSASTTGGSVDMDDTAGPTFTAGVLKSLACAFAADDFALYVDGALRLTDTSSANTPVGMTDVDVGNSEASINQLNGHVRNVQTFRERLSTWEQSRVA